MLGLDGLKGRKMGLPAPSGAPVRPRPDGSCRGFAELGRALCQAMGLCLAPGRYRSGWCRNDTRTRQRPACSAGLVTVAGLVASSFLLAVDLGAQVDDSPCLTALSAGDAPDAALSNSPVLLLWGRVAADGEATLEPAFYLPGQARVPDVPGDHRITGQSQEGATLFSVTARLSRVADGDGGSDFVALVPAQVAWAGRLARITLSGPLGAATMERSSHLPMAIVRDRESGQIRAILRDLPDSIQTRREAQAWVDAQPGQDVFFSRGVPDTRAWCDALEAAKSS